MKHVLIHNIGHSIPLLRMPRPTQGCRTDDDDDDSDYCKQVIGKTIDVECTGIFVEWLKLMYRKLRGEVHVGIYHGRIGRGWFFSEHFGFPVTVFLCLFIHVSSDTV
jgi:hypothetical protein